MEKEKKEYLQKNKESDFLINNKKLGIERIIEIINRLTDEKNGCPWDQIQTHSSLAKHTIEEAYEVAESIETQSTEELSKELGDLLFNILFHTHIGSKNGLFNLNTVIDDIVKKMVTRHPHVFSGKNHKTIKEVNDQWDEIKRKENNISETGQIEQELNNITKNIPALTQSMKIQKIVANIGFDWNTSFEIINKIYEEIDEFIDANDKKSETGKEDELGDILFSVINLARYVGVDPETALRSTNRKFVKRITGMEKLLNQDGKEIKNVDPIELNLIWEKIKYGQ